MQIFPQYLRDIYLLDRYSIDNGVDFDTWYNLLLSDTQIAYANDYAKDCMRVAREKIHVDINKKTLETVEETGAYKYNFAYEECLEIVDNNLK
jgi:hypothetical protein